MKTWLRRLSATLLTFMLAVIVMAAPAMADNLPGLQFSIEPGTGDFLEFQSGPIFEGEPVAVFYDSLRVSQPANPSCGSFKDLDRVTGYVMSDNSGDFKQFKLGPINSGKNYVLVGSFTTPDAYHGSEEIQLWFVGDYGSDECYDSDFGNNYSFPVIIK